MGCGAYKEKDRTTQVSNAHFAWCDDREVWANGARHHRTARRTADENGKPDHRMRKARCAPPRADLVTSSGAGVSFPPGAHPCCADLPWNHKSLFYFSFPPFSFRIRVFPFEVIVAVVSESHGMCCGSRHITRRRGPPRRLGGKKHPTCRFFCMMRRSVAQIFWGLAGRRGGQTNHSFLPACWIFFFFFWARDGITHYAAPGRKCRRP